MTRLLFIIKKCHYKISCIGESWHGATFSSTRKHLHHRFVFINKPYSYHIEKGNDLSRQIKFEVKRLKADSLANQITNNLANSNSESQLAHIKRCHGQSSFINRAC